MKGTLGAGLVLALPLSACGGDDATTFTVAPSAASTTAGSTAIDSLPATTSPGTAATATPAPVGTTSGAATATSAGSSSAMQLKINFTFTATATGGRVNNPYVAVWIEDSAGALVRTVSLWYSTRDSKYLQELSRWYTVDDGGRTDGAIDTVSSGSRVPGAYSVTWDGTDHAGATAPAGSYFVCIEAAREHGPSELIREAVTIGTTPFTKQLSANGELTAAAVELVD